MVKKRLSEAARKRVRAGRLLRAGKRPAEVAEAVGVARQTIYTWKALLDEGGIDALRSVPERGRPAQLDAQQLASVRTTLLQSPTEPPRDYRRLVGVSHAAMADPVSC